MTPPGDRVLSNWTCDVFGDVREGRWNTAGRVLYNMHERGAHEKRIDHDGRELVSGICAGCGWRVTENQRHVIRHHPTLAGGIFHDEPAPFNCAPTHGDWYGLEDE